MNMIIRGGVMLGVLVTAFSWLFAFTGMHKNPGADMTFIIVATVIEIAVLVWALRKTATQGRTWMGQVSAGTMLAFVGGSLIFATSIMLVSYLYPNYFAEANVATEAAYRARGMDDAAVQAAMAKLTAAQTPVAQGLNGFVGTVLTGLIMSAILGIWIRHKGPEAA